jgi:hypothetical protein
MSFLLPVAPSPRSDGRVRQRPANGRERARSWGTGGPGAERCLVARGRQTGPVDPFAHEWAVGRRLGPDA